MIVDAVSIEIPKIDVRPKKYVGFRLKLYGHLVESWFGLVLWNLWYPAYVIVRLTRDIEIPAAIWVWFARVVVYRDAIIIRK